MGKRPSLFWLFLVPVLIAVSVIWLPIGVVELPQVEEWQLFSVFQDHAPVFWVTDGDFAAHRLRPLFLFLDAVAYSTAIPYLTMHALMAVALLVKGVAMAYVAYWLTRNRLISVIAAVVFLLHPADTMQMGFRSLVIIWPVALSVSAIAVLLASADATAFPKKVMLAVAAGALMLIAGLMYEAALMMAIAPLILLLARYGTRARHLLHALWVPALVWSAAIAANLLYILFVQTRGGVTYQGALLAGAPPLSEMPKYLVETGLYRVLLQGWYDGLSMFVANLNFLPYLVVAAAACVWFFIRFRGQPEPDDASAWLGARLVPAGILLAALGYLPFLISTPHIYISQRTYLFASIGGSIFAVGLLVLLKSSRIALAALASLLVISGMGSQWEQLAHYSDLSGRQRMYLSGILAAAPYAAQPEKILLITDKSGALSNTWMLRGENLAAALSYVYGKPVRAAVCAGPAAIYSSFTTDSYGTPGRCVETDKGWDIAKGATNAFSVATADIIRLVISPDGDVTRPGDAARAPDSAQVKRAQAILSCFPCAYTQREPVTKSYRYDFGKWWSLDAVPWGGGWADAAWVIPPARPMSYSWMIAPVSNLFFRVIPQGTDYRIAVRINGSISKLARDSFAMAINGEKIDYIWQTPDIVSGTFRRSVLSDGPNELRLEAAPGPEFSVSNQIDWVDITPMQ